MTGHTEQKAKAGGKGGSLCPSRLALAEFDAAGRGGPLGLHVQACSRCAALLGELDHARSELWGDNPEAASRAAARRILDGATSRQRAQRRRWLLWLPVALVPAVGALALFTSSPGLLRGTAEQEGGATEVAPGAIRAKGGLVLEITCKRGDDQFTVTEGAELRAGDRLRFAYTKPAAGHLMIFSVDDRGEVFPYYEEGALKSLQVGAGAQVLLPGSVELDGHSGAERFYALWSERPIDASSVRAAVSAAMVGGGLAQAGRLGVGADVEQVSYLVRRP